MRFILTILFFVISLNLIAQVENDNIENRILLALNQSHFSSTDDCTLEMNCINKDIVNQCITFHNDQWFEIKPLEDKTYYINISNQKCRDISGVQLLLIDGEPCKPETHKLISCVSLANQNDINVQFDSLIKNKTYLLLVDGYLHDYCSFNIEFSDIPKGFSKNKEPTNTNFYSHQDENFITYNWSVDKFLSDNYEKYIVYRRYQKDKKSQIIREIPHQKTSIGENILSYNSNDTLNKKGKYEYQIYALKYDSTLELIAQFTKFLTKEVTNNKYSTEFLTIQKTYKRKTEITLMVEDVVNNKMIYHNQFPASQEHYKRFYLREFLEKGITQFKVTIQNNKTGRKESQIYNWTDYLINP